MGHRDATMVLIAYRHGLRAVGAGTLHCTSAGPRTASRPPAAKTRRAPRREAKPRCFRWARRGLSRRAPPRSQPHFGMCCQETLDLPKVVSVDLVEIPRRCVGDVDGDPVTLLALDQKCLLEDRIGCKPKSPFLRVYVDPVSRAVIVRQTMCCMEIIPASCRRCSCTRMHGAAMSGCAM
jgi:hypothetical protein